MEMASLACPATASLSSRCSWAYVRSHQQNLMARLEGLGHSWNHGRVIIVSSTVAESDVLICAVTQALTKLEPNYLSSRSGVKPGNIRAVG